MSNLERDVCTILLCALHTPSNVLLLLSIPTMQKPGIVVFVLYEAYDM